MLLYAFMQDGFTLKGIYQNFMLEDGRFGLWQKMYLRRSAGACIEHCTATRTAKETLLNREKTRRSQDGHTLPTEEKSILVCACFLQKSTSPTFLLSRSLSWTSSLLSPDFLTLTWLWLTAWHLFTSETMFQALISERGCLLQWFAYRLEDPRYASLR